MTAPHRDRSAQPSLDRLDRRILDHLADHGRSSLADLAEAVSISPSSAQRRLRRLESEQVVRGYRAVLDPVAVDHHRRLVGVLLEDCEQVAEEPPLDRRELLALDRGLDVGVL